MESLLHKLYQINGSFTELFAFCHVCWTFENFIIFEVFEKKMLVLVKRRMWLTLGSE